MMVFRALAPSVALMLAISGCSVFPPPSPPPALHDLGPSGNRAEPTQATWSTVEVDAPQWLQDEHIRYRLLYADPTRVRLYARDQWLAPPPSLLAQRLSLAGGGRGYRLHIRLLDFEQTFDGPKSARVILTFVAKAVTPETSQTAGQRVFQLNRTASSADAAGAVAAFAALVDEAVILIGAWVAEMPAYPEAEGTAGH